MILINFLFKNRFHFATVNLNFLETDMTVSSKQWSRMICNVILKICFADPIIFMELG